MENLVQLAQEKEEPLRRRNIIYYPPAPHAMEPQPETKIVEGDGANSPAQAEPDLLDEAREFISRVRLGANFDESSLTQGVEISRQIESRLQTSEAALEQGFGPLFVEQGKILNSYKKYAQDHNRSWKQWAEKCFPHIKERKRQNLMFMGNHPEIVKYLYMGVDRALRFSRAGKKFDRKEGMGKLVEKYNLTWDPKGSESLLDFGMRVDKAISDQYGGAKPAGRSSKRLLADLQKWIKKGKTLIENILSDETACGRLGIVDVESIEQSIVKLREAIEVAA